MKVTVACLGVWLALTGTAASQTSSFAGVWKLNVEKTRLASGTARPITMTITVNGDEESMRTDGPNANGYTARYDGKDYPMRNMATGLPTGVMTSLTRIDERTVDRTETRDGKVTSITRRVLSPDGKVMTSTTPGTDRNGQATISIRIWEKQ